MGIVPLISLNIVDLSCASSHNTKYLLNFTGSVYKVVSGAGGGLHDLKYVVLFISEIVKSVNEFTIDIGILLDVGIKQLLTPYLYL